MSVKRKPEHRICSRCSGWFMLQGQPLQNQRQHQRQYSGLSHCPQCTGHADTPDRYMLAERVEMSEVIAMGRAIMRGEALE